MILIYILIIPNAVSSALIADFAALNLFLCNTGPTHTAGRLLDPILSNLSCLRCNSALPLCWSDHFLVKFYCTFSFTSTAVPVGSPQRSRNWSKLDMEVFNKTLVDSAPIIEHMSTTSLSIIQDWISDAVEHCLPLSVKKNPTVTALLLRGLQSN